MIKKNIEHSKRSPVPPDNYHFEFFFIFLNFRKNFSLRNYIDLYHDINDTYFKFENIPVYDVKSRIFSQYFFS